MRTVIEKDVQLFTGGVLNRNSKFLSQFEDFLRLFQITLVKQKPVKLTTMGSQSGFDTIRAEN